VDEGDEDERDAGSSRASVASETLSMRGAEASEAVRTWLAEQLEGREDDKVTITISIEEAE
jgi:hypothetical protein